VGKFIATQFSFFKNILLTHGVKIKIIATRGDRNFTENGWLKIDRKLALKNGQKVNLWTSILGVKNGPNLMSKKGGQK
jgi:hypothetical protein